MNSGSFAMISGWSWFTFSTIIQITAFILVCLHCLSHRREPTSALLWIILAGAFPIVGPLFYLFFGIYRVPETAEEKELSHKKFLNERQARTEASRPLAHWRAVQDLVPGEPQHPFVQEFNRAINPILPDAPMRGGNVIRPLITGDDAFPQMLEAMQNAKHHIHLQTFILGSDPIGHQFLTVLEEKAKQGVHVRLLYERFGSTKALFAGFFEKYEQMDHFQIAGWTRSNLLKRQYHFNLRNHRKLLIVDGAIAFAGGLNLHIEHTTHGKWRPIRDYHFALQGPVVQELQYSFLRDWYFITEENPEVLLQPAHFPHLKAEGTASLRVVNSGPSDEMDVFADVLFTAITMARQQILAVTPYFIPTMDIIRALRIAALRGVDVKLVVPKENNHFYAGLAGRALYEEMMEAGVRIFERRPPFMHAKALLVDDALALIGTANLDVRSLRLNYETNLAVFDETFINNLKRIVLEEISMSDEMDLATWRKRPSYQRLLENCCNLLTPIL